jgi:hypothetical protein
MESKKDEAAQELGVNREELAKMNAEAQLIDVKIDGDTARGKQTAKSRNRSIETPLAFKKIDGSWRIDLMALETPF